VKSAVRGPRGGLLVSFRAPKSDGTGCPKDSWPVNIIMKEWWQCEVVVLLLSKSRSDLASRSLRQDQDDLSIKDTVHDTHMQRSQPSEGIKIAQLA
jgi:hypothetical protein